MKSIKTPIEKGLSFYEKTIKTTQKILDQSHKTKYNLDYQNQHQDQEVIDLTDWMSECLNTHQKGLEHLLENNLEDITTMLMLIRGFHETINKDTKNIIGLLNKLEKQIKTGKEDQNLLKTIENALEKKYKLGKFFEEEVQERSSNFSQTLSTYITHLTVLKHLTNCARSITPTTKPTSLERKLKNLKNPML